MTHLTRRTILAAGPSAFAAAALPARATEKYGPGVTDTEIKIGNTGPYSGPLANASPFPLSEKAYFEMINAEGGINGRKITWISYDDGYSPPKTVEMTRRLVEEDNVLCLSGSIGTPTNSAVWRYLNEKKYRNCSPAPAPPSETTRRAIRGRWASSSTTRPRDTSTRHTS